MNKIVREAYPASKLPKDLREGIDAGSSVKITVEELEPPTEVLTLDEIFALRRPPYRSKEDIDAEIRQLREEWDDRG
jgi:hypothetical protein